MIRKCVLVAVASGLVATSASAAPRWGVPTDEQLSNSRTVVQVVKDAAGVPQIARNVGITEADDEGGLARTQINARGDIVDVDFGSENDASPQLVFVPAGGQPQRTPLPGVPSSGEGGESLLLGLDLDDAGNASAIWAASRGLSFMRRPAAAGVWSAPEIVSPTASFEFDLTRDGEDLVATWTAGTTLWMATRDAATGTWSPPSSVASNVRTDEGPYIFAGPAGQRLIVWTEPLRLADGRTWHRLRSALRPTETDPWVLSRIRTSVRTIRLIGAGMDDAGNALIGWLEGTGPIRTATLRAGEATWVKDPPIDAKLNSNDTGPVASLQMTGDGWAAIGAHVEDDGSGTALPVRVWRRSAGSGWIDLGEIPTSAPVASFTGFPGLNDVTFDLAPNGWVLAGMVRHPEQFLFPSSNKGLAPVPTVAVASPTSGFGPTFDLDDLSTRDAIVHLDSIGIGPDGTARAVWSLGAIDAPPTRVRTAEYSETASQRPTPPLMAITASRGPGVAVQAGSLAWLRLTLSRPVEAMPVVVFDEATPRRTVAARWHVSGKDVFVPVRMTTPGQHRYVVELSGSVTATIPVRGIARTARTIPISGHLGAIAADQNRVWVLTNDRTSPFTSRVRSYDARTGKPLGPAIPAGQSPAIAAGPRYAWLMNERAVTPIDVRTNRRQAPIPVTADIAMSTNGIASAGLSDVWVLLADPGGERPGALVMVEGQTRRVVRRIPLPRRVPFFDFPAGFSVVGNTAYIAGSCFGCGDAVDPPDLDYAMRVDLRSGTVTRLPSQEFGGFGQTVRFANGRVRLGSGGPSLPHPRPQAGSLEQFEPLSVGPDGLWAVRPPTDDRLFAAGASLRYFDFRRGRLSRPIEVNLPRQELPTTLAVEEHVAAVPGGAWVGLEEYGVIVRVPTSRAGTR